MIAELFSRGLIVAAAGCLGFFLPSLRPHSRARHGFSAAIFLMLLSLPLCIRWKIAVELPVRTPVLPLAEGDFRHWLLMPWLAGIVLLLSRELLAWRAWHALLRHSQPCSTSWESSFLILAEPLGRRLGRVQLRESREIAGPLVGGLWSPTILLPASRRFSAKERRLILLHECAHLRRGDLWVDLFARMACALHWFNPMVWWAHHLTRRAREEACDAFVIAQGNSASRYAKLLLTLSCARSACPAVAMAQGRLESRIRAMISSTKNAPSGSRRISLLLLAASAIIASLALFSHRTPVPMPSEQSQDGDADIRLQANPFPGNAAEEI